MTKKEVLKYMVASEERGTGFCMGIACFDCPVGKACSEVSPTDKALMVVKKEAEKQLNEILAVEALDKQIEEFLDE